MDQQAVSDSQNHAAASEVADARLRVIVAFAHWLWCQKQLKDLVNSFDSFEASVAWLTSFSQLRRAARNAEFRWVAALYPIKIVGTTGEQDAHQQR